MTSTDEARERFELLLRARVAQDLEPDEIDSLFRRWSAMQRGLADLEPLLDKQLEPLITVSLGDAS
jgi:hypothetical protein